MAQLDLSKWSIVARKDDSGFGRMSMMIKRALGITRHIAIPSDRLDDRPLEGTAETWLSPEEPISRVEEEIAGSQGIIFFEHCNWHSEMVPVAKRMGVKTVCVPTWEWFRGVLPIWKDVDFLACPSEWTLKIVQSYGYDRAAHVTWPLDTQDLPYRKITGPARLFIHNAGLVDSQDRKGTADTIRAFSKVRNPDVRLKVRLQKEAKLPAGNDRVEIVVGNLDDHKDLYREGDVAIQPSKMEGIGFMVLEPFCCGIPVITLNYPPMSEYVQDQRMLVKPRLGKRRAFPTQWVRHAHLRIPATGDLAKKIAWCSENDLSAISEANRREAEERYARDKIIDEWSQALDRVLQRP